MPLNPPGHVREPIQQLDHRTRAYSAQTFLAEGERDGGGLLISHARDGRGRCDRAVRPPALQNVTPWLGARGEPGQIGSLLGRSFMTSAPKSTISVLVIRLPSCAARREH